MMTASSTNFITALMAQTGDFIQDLIPLFLILFGFVVAFIAFKIIVNAFIIYSKKLFK